MTYRLLACAVLIALFVPWISDRALGLDCVGPASTEISLSLISLERIDGSGDVDAERARLGDTSTVRGIRSARDDADGSRHELVRATWTSAVEFLELESTP